MVLARFEVGPSTDYPFYSVAEQYVPKVTADGGILSSTDSMYNPTLEQEAADRKAAYEAGIPHGYCVPGEKYANDTKIYLTIVSELHSDNEYGVLTDIKGKHYGGPFQLEVSPRMTVQDVRLLIRDAAGIPPGLLKLSYRGVDMENSTRRLEQYGVSFWYKNFPNWPLVIRRF